MKIGKTGWKIENHYMNSHLSNNFPNINYFKNLLGFMTYRNQNFNSYFYVLNI